MIYSIKDDLENVSADAFGKALKGLGLNLIVRQIAPHVDFLKEVFDVQEYQVASDFALLIYADHLFQLHADHTYNSHPLLQLLPENPPIGTGVGTRLYESDPNICHDLAVERGDSILQIPIDKPHSVRESAILSHDGHVWVPSKSLAD